MLFQSFTLKTSCTSCCASYTSAVGFRSVNCGALSLISVTNIIGTEADFDGVPKFKIFKIFQILCF